MHSLASNLNDRCIAGRRFDGDSVGIASEMVLQSVLQCCSGQLARLCAREAGPQR